MLVKEAGKQVDFKVMDKAQKHNEDGYGVSWYEDGMVKTYKTFNYSTFKGVVAALKQYSIVAHLRYATRGDKSFSNIHPFDVPSGVLYHNGTIFGLGDSTKSDSQELADTLMGCEYKYVEDIAPLLKPYIDDKINRLVFFEDNGRITIMNQHLGIQEEGVWYSNDYHLKDEGWCRGGKCNGGKPQDKGLSTGKINTEKTLTKMNSQTSTNLDTRHKVYVYGTLKKGYNNHRLLEKSQLLGKATSLTRWTMIGKNMPFPYVLHRDDVAGTHIVGEVYEVDNTTLKALDTLEGFPYHYKKTRLAVRYKDGGLDDVTMYVKTNVTIGDLNREFIKEWSK